jgi:CRP-like cAMP-binding protein
LLLLDEKFKSSHQLNATSDINLSRADLANIAGTAKESLVRLLQDFKRAGLIEKTNKTIRIIDRNGMIREANLMGSNPKQP